MDMDTKDKEIIEISTTTRSTISNSKNMSEDFILPEENRNKNNSIEFNTNITGSDNTMDIVTRLMKVTKNDITDKSQR